MKLHSPRRLLFHIGLSLAGTLLMWAPPVGALTVRGLRCEYHVNPAGIDASRPRLTWQVASAVRGDIQTAYHILCASRPGALRRGQGDLWDSGRVPSGETVLIPYGGRALRSGEQVWWSVRAWDRFGRPSAWSRPAFWTMGLLRPADWKARWISAPPPPPNIQTAPSNAFAGLNWVWTAGENALADLPVKTRYFRSRFTLPAGRTVRSAQFLISADDRFTLWVNGRKAGSGSLWSHPETISLKPLLQAGDNTVALAVTNNGGPAGLLGRLKITFESGPPMTLPVDTGWKASTEGADGWTSPDFDDSAWPSAQAVAPVGAGPWGIPGQKPVTLLPPSPLLRTTFGVSRQVTRAMLYVTALGLYEARLNGRRVSGLYFTPGWTDYRKRLSYQTYDVTKMLRTGRNALSAVLADGWASGYVAFGRRDLYGIGRPRLLAQLNVEYSDGSMQTIGTGPSWKAAYGPIREADILMGETYDARRALPGWDSPAYSNASWKPVVVRASWPAPLQAYVGEPVRRVMEIGPIHRSQPKPGVFVFDMGQNMDGWVRLRVRGARGKSVTLRFGEMLNPDGTIYTANLRTARATDIYTLRGGPTEVWEPRFTYHGFRFVEVTGYPGTPPLDAIQGVVVSSMARETGHFSSSSPMLNALARNIIWTQRDNFIEIPTGCAQRDERLGWTGDALLFARTSTATMDTGAFLTKWMTDLRDAQLASGAFPDIAPDLMGTGGSSGWSDAGIVIPWTLYQVYGDKDIIRGNWAAMQRWMAAEERGSAGLLRPASGFGDWLSVGADTPVDVISTAWFAHGAHLMAAMARAIGRNEDARHYDDLFEGVRGAFVRAFVAPDGRVKGDTQTAYSLALAFDLIPEDRRAAAVDHLAADVRAHGGHLTTGFLGSAELAAVLTHFGHTDAAYRMVLQPTPPGWGYQIRLGATTLWERWDSWTPERGFGDPAMNSFNHFAFGSIGEWLVRDVTGLDTDSARPGFRRILVHPHPGGGVRDAKMAYESVRGQVNVRWKQETRRFLLDLSIPANTSAIVTLPASPRANITEGRHPISQMGARNIKAGRGSATFEIGSGSYHFVSVVP